jgi:hypothetical protein
VLTLEQDDASEDFIDFLGSSSSGSTTSISTDVPSSYYGKIRVSVNGVPKWLALYN